MMTKLLIVIIVGLIVTSFFLKRVLNKRRRRALYSFMHAISLIRYEEGRYRLLILWQLIVFFFLRMAALCSRGGMRDKFRVHLRFFNRKYFLRHPMDLLNYHIETLRVCPTYRCNANCKFCYAHGLIEEFPKDMSLMDFRNLIKHAKKLGWKRIHFYGGEPTIHHQFGEMLSACQEEGMLASLSTNALFGLETLKSILSNLSVRRITITYPQYELSSERYERFMKNLSFLHMGRVQRQIRCSVLVTYVIGSDDKNYWKGLVDFLCLNRSLVLGLTLLMPGFSKEISSEELFQKEMRKYAHKTLEIVKNCAEKNIPFHFFRPVPSCLFNSEELKYLNGLGRFLFFTRCPLGYKGDYSSMVTVNPELSLYPCTAVFTKGPRFDSFNTRGEINSYFRQRIEGLLRTPITDRCLKCQRYKNFLSKLGTAQERLSDRKICQGGCFDFRIGLGEVCKG